MERRGRVGSVGCGSGSTGRVTLSRSVWDSVGLGFGRQPKIGDGLEKEARYAEDAVAEGPDREVES